MAYTTSATTKGGRNGRSFGLKVEMKVSVPGVDKATVQALVEDAREICPYSRATRRNVLVTLTVI